MAVATPQANAAAHHGARDAMSTSRATPPPTRTASIATLAVGALGANTAMAPASSAIAYGGTT